MRRESEETSFENRLTNGMWKFSDRVGMQTLIGFAEFMRDNTIDGFRYQDIAIRQCSRNQIAIWFTYIREIETRESHDSYFKQMTDRFKKRFGNDFVGWDISSSMTVVK